MLTPSVVTVVRTRKRPAARLSRATLWAQQREFLRRESTRWFLLEVLAFGMLLAISAWSLFHTVEAMRLL